MAQESRLGITIDSRGAEQNANRMADSLDRMEKSGDAAAASADGVSSSAAQQKKELAQLLGQINPTVAALGRLDDMQDKLAKFKKAGIVESDTFVEYRDRLNLMRNELARTSDGMNKAGMSAKAMAANLRVLPAQITDITVGLATGQSPFTVFLQQGGQLKDMFGGIGPAARAVGGYIAGLVNPFTLAAAAAAALTVAYYQGSEESERFGRVLIENGNAAGTSANQLSDLANQVASTGTTVGAAAEVLTKLAAAGNPLTSMYADITQASLAWSKQTGRDVKEVVQSFNDIAKSPVEAIKKLDAELNILTASQYANIASLQEQGNTMGAAKMAAGIYAEEISTRAGEIEKNLGSLEGAWKSVASFAKSAWDAMLDIGRDKSLEQQLAEVENKIADASKGIKQGGRAAFGLGLNIQNVDQLKKQAAELQAAIAEVGRKSAEDAASKAIQDAGKKGVDTINATFKASQTQTEKLNKQLIDLDKARASAQKAGGFTAEEETKFAVARKNIEQQIADIKEREAKKNKPKAVKGLNRGVPEAENTFAKLYSQYDPAAQAARALTKEQTQLQLVLSKGKITQEQYGKALAQASTNYAAAIKGAQGLTQAEQYRAQLEKQLSTQRTQYSLEAAGVGMGDQQSQRLQQRVQLEQQTNDRILELRTELANATTEKQRQDLQAQIDLTNEYLPLQIEAVQAGWAQMDQAMLNPINGWTAAMQNFGTQAMNIAGQTQSIFSGAFSSISTSITTALASGSLSLSTLGDIGRTVVSEILSGFIRMGVQIGINSALSAAFSAKEIAQSTTETSIKVGGAAAVATAKVTADGVATASSLAATATVEGAQVAAAGSTLAAWLPAALVASVGSFGAAAIVGGTALLAAFALTRGFSTGGHVSGPGTGTSDSIPARLSDGEFVVNAAATKRNRGLLEAINSNERVSVSGGGGAGGVSLTQSAGVVVNIHEDASRGGQVQSRNEGGRDIVDIWVASVMSDGPAHQAMAEKYGLSTVGS
ncbi:phage tail length tape measure family protein [Pseudomonas paracarnis]|uniref:phage tail length tape measure family protein n=1 Tax=Pseudomonas paracarnis TaxID=2750625 RepID=UPI001C6F771B|nr:phage tail length tape measure family protein [Pseudomonas paracarnis]MBW9246940.1 phage tail length tape measure family protein [Pseudomonas paracarnis]